MQITLTHIAQDAKPKVNRLWVDYDYFCRTAKNISDINARKFKFRNRWNINLNNQINLFSVPNTDRLRYGVALDNNVIVAQIELLKKEDSEEAERCYAWNEGEKRTHHVHEQMLAAVGEFAQYRAKLAYIYTTLDKEKLTEFAKRWAVWVYIMENYTRFGNSLEIYHAAYSLIFPQQFSGANGKISFKNFYNKCEGDGVEATVIDKRTVTKVKDRRSPVQMAFLQTLFIQNRKITAADAAKKLVEFCKGQAQGQPIQGMLKPMSHSNVKIIFREFQNNEELFKARYGEAAGQKQTAHASLLAAEHRNTQWQIDGWTLPFWGENFQRHVLYLVRDNHSRKIVGYSVAESENTTLILEGLDDAMRNTGVFPGELVSDKHSFHKTQTAARLRAETEKMGAVWTVTVNAQRNQLAERYNQYLDAICKEFPGYLGKNITATGKDARPAPEVLTEYAKKGNFKTLEEIKSIAGYAVVEFNRTQLAPLEGVSPNDKYDASESIKAFPISEADRVRLIKPLEWHKVIRGQVTIKVGVRKHEFVLPAALIDLYNNQQVEVTYEDLTEGIYIADTKSGEMLDFLHPKRKIHGAIPDQTAADRDLINKLTGKQTGTATKSRKTAIARIAEGLKDNPEAMALINTHAMPKNIRQIAQQDAEVKRHLQEQGVKNDMVPIRKVAAVGIAALAPKVVQKKKLFAPKGDHVMRKITPQDN